MLRLETATGWWLITHPDHARLAGAFAAHWGNQRFAQPHPRTSVLHGIYVHDDGWAIRDAHPSITRAGKPSAFSTELVGKYSAFEEIDLGEYLAVREQAVARVEMVDAFAALLVSMHTYNLLTAHADRSTIAADQLPLLDDFLRRQNHIQSGLQARIRRDPRYTAEDTATANLLDGFRLLQACDNLSLLSCVAYLKPATLLHALPTVGGGCESIAVEPIAPRHFRLTPYPFDEPALTFHVPARHVDGHRFDVAEDLQALYAAAPVEELEIRLTA